MPLVVCRRAHKETLLCLWLFVGGLTKRHYYASSLVVCSRADTIMPLVVCRRAHVLFMLFVSLFTYSLTHIVLCFCFVFSSYCLTYVASFSELSIFDCPFGIL